MESQPLDDADKIALRELLNFGLSAPVPDHTGTAVESSPTGQSSLVKRPCPGSGKPADRVQLDKVGHETIPATIKGVCSGHCGIRLDWDFYTHSWTIPT